MWEVVNFLIVNLILFKILKASCNQVWRTVHYYLPNKKVAANFVHNRLLLNDLPILKNGDVMKALQISKPAVQTVSL